MPPLLILGGVSGAGMTTIMSAYRPLFMVVTFGFLGLAFYLTYRPARVAPPSDDKSNAAAPDRSHRSTLMTMNKVMLWAVTVIVIVFLFFPGSMTGLFTSNDVFTADMDRTVIKIEGMT